jgi:holo-[acyl-carrier protein] synthase
MGYRLNFLIGTDITEIDRIENAIEKGNNGKFLERVYTPLEIEYCESRKNSRFQSYAARFAAKEAIAKAFGTGIGQNAEFNEIEILNDSSGKPYAYLHGKAKQFFYSLGGTSISITLSHCRQYAVAYALIIVA